MIGASIRILILTLGNKAIPLSLKLDFAYSHKQKTLLHGLLKTLLYFKVEKVDTLVTPFSDQSGE